MKVICEICNNEMIERDGKYGKFYGCSNYPKCRNTKKIEQVAKENNHLFEYTKGTFYSLEKYLSEEDIFQVEVRLLNKEGFAKLYMGGIYIMDAYLIYQNKYIVRVTRFKYDRPNFDTNIWTRKGFYFWKSLSDKHYHVTICKIEDLKKIEDNNCEGKEEAILFYNDYDPFAQRWNLMKMEEGWVENNKFYYWINREKTQKKYKRLNTKSIVKLIKIK